MFSLIITIISIALVAALALATLYFGGDAFNQGSAKAAASTVVNQAQQINGANTLHYLDVQSYATDVQDLVDGDYLASAPNPGTISSSDYAIDTDGSISLDGVTSAVCDAINDQSGLGKDNRPADLAAAEGGVAQFSCFGAADGSGTFFFK